MLRHPSIVQIASAATDADLITSFPHLLFASLPKLTTLAIVDEMPLAHSNLLAATLAILLTCVIAVLAAEATFDIVDWIFPAQSEQYVMQEGSAVPGDAWMRAHSLSRSVCEQVLFCAKALPSNTVSASARTATGALTKRII